MSAFKLLLATMRPPFLILTPACVSVGVATAFSQTKHANGFHILMVLVGAVAAHICVNVFNEYFDFKSGLDAKTQRTPFSGGSGTLPAHPEMAKKALILAWSMFGITAAVGLYFAALRGWWLMPPGIVGLLLLLIYTIWLAYKPILCLLAPGLGFGVIMVMGTHFALTGSYSLTSFISSLVPTFLVINLLLLNQFPDVDADLSIGRKNYPIVIGRRTSSTIYGLFLLLTYSSIIAAVGLRLLPVSCLMALLTSILAWQAYRGARHYADNAAALIPFMRLNVIINLLTPILLSVGLFMA